MLVSFDIKFIRQDQKQHRNGEAFRASLTCFWSSLINLISKDKWFSIQRKAEVCPFILITNDSAIIATSLDISIPVHTVLYMQ